jgi:hypothetical protein
VPLGALIAAPASFEAAGGLATAAVATPVRVVVDEVHTASAVEFSNVEGLIGSEKALAMHRLRNGLVMNHPKGLESSTNTPLAPPEEVALAILPDFLSVVVL